MSAKRFRCNFCGKTYGYKSGMKRHQRTSGCEYNVNIDPTMDLKAQVYSLKLLLKERNKQLKEKDDQIHSMHEEIKDLIKKSAPTNTINNNTDNSIHITTNQIRGLLMEHSTGPVLEKITDMSQVFNEEDELFLEDIAYDHRQKILHKTLGDSLVAIYKTADPKNQAVWNTDSSRLNYLIKHAVGRKKVGWMMDKKGVQVVANIIAPVLEYLREKMDSYVPDMDIPKTFETKGVLLAITKEINDGTLAERINKHIANHFYMTEHARKMIAHKGENIEQIE